MYKGNYVVQFSTVPEHVLAVEKNIHFENIQMNGKGN
jgi:hypothetical protein